MCKFQKNSWLCEIKTHGTILACFVGTMWCVACVDFFIGGQLRQYGIVPRTQLGLRGVFFAPFLHANFAHLIANTLPLISLGWFVMLRRTGDFYWVTVMAMLIGGLGTWLIGASHSVHIGASGVVFGYLGFLISRGYFERSLLSVLASGVIAFVYGGLLWGVLPGQNGISWEGHLFGSIGGMLAARKLAKK
ncbi:MAG: rhomboid family intramembrane serine protease [Cytophaga sp.]|nr:rhomboid family intramembrane serine protease [Undibacterium sp.]